MPFKETSIPDLLIYQPKVLQDERGYFYESFNKKVFKEEAGLDIEFVQDNQSMSRYGVLRGLHYQVEPFAQAKLVRVIVGKVLDVAVDIRKGSPTFGKSFSIELSEDNHEQLFIPRGFAHGFVVLSHYAVFSYKCDNYYSREHDSGIYFNDPEFDIDWILPKEELILSEKDKNLPRLKDARNNFNYKRATSI